MASRPRFCTSEEVLDEIYADPGSDFNSESSSDEIEEYHDQQSSSESSENEEMIENDNQSINNKDQQANARGRGHNRGAARGNRAVRRAVRRNRQQEDALLEIQWTSNDRQPRIPQFTARQGSFPLIGTIFLCNVELLKTPFYWLLRSLELVKAIFYWLSE